jgi:hypothetical protein
LTISIHPTLDFNLRSGMATSTRSAAISLWGARLPADNVEKLAKTLFACDNPPGTKQVSGSQDSIGIVYPGLAKSDYEGEYWPKRISSIQDEHTLKFMEAALYLIPLSPRPSGYHVLDDIEITPAKARALTEAAEACWKSILTRDLAGFGRDVRAGFEAQVAMFPQMLTDSMRAQIENYQSRALGWKVSGAGGGGYLILVAERPIAHAIRISIRRQSD